MSQFSFPEVRSSIFELHTQPQLFYLRHFGGSDAPKPPQALHTHQDLTELLFIEEGTGKYMAVMVTGDQAASTHLMHRGCTPQITVVAMSRK